MEIKNIIANNLIELRKEHKLTQAEFASKLNYTDKAISKWERAESVPSIEVLKQIADMFSITVDYLITEGDKKDKEQFVLPKENYSNKITICALINSIVWLLATILYVYTLINTGVKIWEVFIWSVPICSILTSFMNRYWGKRKYSVYLTSITFWSLIISIYIQALEFNIWPIFIIGAPLQVTTILWSRIRPKKTKDKLFQADK